MCSGLSAELLATLAPASRHNGAACAGAHPETETVGLGPPTVVGLIGTLAHADSA